MVLWYFWIYSFLGYLLERAFAAVTHAEHQGRRCFLLLPLCPVYGLGMLAVLALPPDWTEGGWLVISGGLAATAVESPGPRVPALYAGLGHPDRGCGVVDSALGGEAGQSDSPRGDVFLPAAFYCRCSALSPFFVGDR